MFQNLFSEPTTEDLIKILKKDKFNESDANEVLEYVDINSVDNDGKTFLHHMCINNISEPINWLVKKGINKEQEDYYDDTALVLAVKNNSLKAFVKLLECGYDVDKQNRYGRTVLQESLTFGDLNYFNKIVKHTKDINILDKSGRNILFDAVITKNHTIINEILSTNIDKSIIDKQGKPALLLSEVVNDPAILNVMIEGGVDISLKDGDGNNLLYHLMNVESMNHESIEYVISKKIDVNSVNEQGNTILIELIYLANNKSDEYITQTKNEEVTKKIFNSLLNKVDVNYKNKNGNTALMIAAEFNDKLCVEELIARGADVNAADIEGNTALSISIIKGKDYKDVAKVLLTNGAKIDIKDVNDISVVEKVIDIILKTKNKKRISPELSMKIDEDSDYLVILKEMFSKGKVDLSVLNSIGEPYFFEPILYGNTDLINLLTRVGYHINQTDKDGLNIIYKIMGDYNKTPNNPDKKYFATLKTVLDMRANVNALDKFGGTTVHKAILENDVKTVRMLVNAHADINATDKQGRNFIHNAIWKNKVQILRVMHSQNTNLINTPDNYGVLPIHYAAFLGYTDLVVELMTLGSVINNSIKKEEYILKFLKKFHKNIMPMFKSTKNSTDQRNVAKLIENMRKEFHF